MKRSLTSSPVLAAIMLALAGSAFAQEQVIKIGQTGPLSGPNAFAGKDNENGTRLAVEELNAKKIKVAGKTLKFELVSEDDQCDPKSGVSVAQKMVDSCIKYVMGPYCSGVAIPTSRVYDDGSVLVSTVGTNPKVTDGGYKNIFRIVAVIDDRTAFGQGLAAEFMKEAKNQGLTVVAQEYTTDKSTDFSAILTSIKAKKPEVIFYGGYAPQAAPMVRQMKQLAVTAKMLGGDTLCSPEMGKIGGEAINDVVFCAQGGAMLDKSTDGPAFKAKYKKRFNQDADVYAASFYDQAMFVAQSMSKVGSVEPEKVSMEMRKGSYKGVAANYAYDDKGNMKQAPITVFTFKNTQLAPLASY